MTVVNGMDIDNYINSEYDYDFFFTADMNSTYFLDEDFAEQIQQSNGIKDISATRISSVELRASESLNAYAGWIAEKLGLSADTTVSVNNRWSRDYGKADE